MKIEVKNKNKKRESWNKVGSMFFRLKRIWYGNETIVFFKNNKLINSN